MRDDDELLALRREHEKLLAAYGRLKWAIDGTAADLEVALSLTNLRARIIAVLMSGKAYSADQLLSACWLEDPDSGTATVSNVLSQMKKYLPWFEIHPVQVGRKRNALYKLTPQCLEYIKAKLKEAGG